MKRNNIVLTGGHAATTALAVVREIKKRRLPWKIFWIGPYRAIEGSNIATLESDILPKHGIVFKPIFTGRIQRKFTKYTIPSLLRIPFGFIHAFILLASIRPKLILSFGGYAAFPVVIIGWLLGIPILIHEQTAAIGRANKYSSPFAKAIALAREESFKFFPSKKCVLTGNPILPEFLTIPSRDRLSFPPVIFITGGSRGSTTVNELVAGILERLLRDYIVVHQSGNIDYEKYLEIRRELPPELRKRYQVYSHVSSEKMYELLRESDIVVARAGANTVSELIAAKKISILIPIPFSYLDEQTKNALFAEKLGLARVLPQAEATPERLLSEINHLVQNWEKTRKKIKNIQSPDIRASARVVNLMLESAKK